MATATAPTTAPTEAEIRKAVADDEYSWGQLSDAFSALCGTLDRIYDADELRKSERADLDAAAEKSLMVIRDRVMAEAADALVAAGLAFAAEHPDAPRAVDLNELVDDADRRRDTSRG